MSVPEGNVRQEEQGGSFTEDFICVSEFSEIVGPVPLFCVPADDAFGKFNLERFVIRIMAVDNNQKNCETGSLMEDTQAVISETDEDAFAYVHHFTLFDVLARGYVRPICMSYITRSPTKIMDNFLDILDRFSEISLVLKTGNQLVFLRDLEDRIEQTRERQEEEKGAESAGTDDGTGGPPPMDDSGDESEKENDKGENTSPDKSETTFSSTEAPDSTAQAILDAMGSQSAEIHDYSFIAQTPSLENEIQEMEKIKQKIQETLKHSIYTEYIAKHMEDLDIDDSQNKENPEEPGSSGATTSTTDTQTVPHKARTHRTPLTKGRRFETKLRDLPELCGFGHTLGFKKLQQLQQHYSRYDIVLSLENEEYLMLSPPSSLLSIGGTLVANFNLHAVSSHSPYGSPSQSQRDIRRRSRSLSHNDDSDSSTSGESSYGSPRESSPSRGEELDGNVLKNKLQLWHNSGEVDEIYRGRGRGRGDSKDDRKDALRTHILVGTFRERSDSDINGGISPRLRSPRLPIFPNSRMNVDSFASVLWNCATSPAGRGLMMYVQKYSFVKHLVFSLLKGRPVVICGKPNHESEIRKLVSAFSFFVPGHLLVSQWRTDTLCMSDLAHLKLIGIPKRGASIPIPKAVERYVSIFDIETEHLRCPVYNKGALINDILGVKKQWPNEETYLAYIHYKLLDIGIKACLYYHLCCVPIDTGNNSGQLPPPVAPQPLYHAKAAAKHSSMKYNRLPNSQAGPGNNRPKSKHSRSDGHLDHFLVPASDVAEKRQAKISFFKNQIMAKQHDMLIIEYFAEVVKEQQAFEMQEPEIQVAPVIRLDYTPCITFSNTNTARPAVPTARQG